MEDLMSHDTQLCFISHDDMKYSFEKFNKREEYTNINCMFTISKFNRIEKLEFFIKYSLTTKYITNKQYVKSFICDQAYYNENKETILNMLLYCGKLGGCYFADVVKMIEVHFEYEYDDRKDTATSVSILTEHLKQCKNQFIVYFSTDEEDPYNMEEVKIREKLKLEFKANYENHIRTIKRQAATRIQKMFRGWLVRKNHTWNPHTPIGKLFCKKDFMELIKD